MKCYQRVFIRKHNTGKWGVYWPSTLNGRHVPVALGFHFVDSWADAIGFTCALWRSVI
jgi:hypothetical protein